jgi:hypothetical protein
MDSKIIFDSLAIEIWLDNKAKSFVLLYRASRDGWGPNVFH